MNILFAASEAFPYIKTGGLGDVVHALPAALQKLGDEARIVLPAYRSVLEQGVNVVELGILDVQGANTRHKMRILQVDDKKQDVVVYLIDIPALYDRAGNPYVDANGIVWPDNAERYVVFSRAVALLTKFLPGLKGGKAWVPEVVHSNDWQTGLVPAFLSKMGNAPATVFTIHNLAYDGHFSYDEFTRLSLPAEWWSPDYIEFYDGFSMLKAGLVFSDAVTTVSPNYAKEICTEKYGNRFEGVLSSLGDKFSGILNGIDLEIWNPETDPYIKQNYTYENNLMAAKRANKMDLLERTGLSKKQVPVLGFVGRLVEQKGIDLIISILPELFEKTDVSIVILGAGQEHYEAQLIQLMDEWPDRLHIHIGYSEELAHQIEAGCDLFLMPSMFEPCGLNQMYSLRYGALPIVTNTGGLTDTVVNVTFASLQDQTATGFVMEADDAGSLLVSISHALELYKQSALWEQVIISAMMQDLGWDSSAQAYRKLYKSSRSGTRKTA